MMETGPMPDGFSKLRGRSRLPDPPKDALSNLQAPENAPVGIEASRGGEDLSAGARPRIDGRSRLRKDRTEALSTKIKRRHRELLMDLADAYNSTLSETLEKAIETLADQARGEGKLRV